MIHESLLYIGLLVVVAKLAEGILRRIGLMSIVAYTLAGVLLGPVAGIIEPTAEMELFLSIGVFVLFFLIGLDEIDIPGFMATIRGRYFVAGSLSVLISVLISLLVTSDLIDSDFTLGLEFTKAVCLAGILSLSSLGIVAKVLSDKGLLKEMIGLRIFTAVIIAEVLSLLVVGVTIGELDHERSMTGVIVLVGQIAGFVILTWLVAAKLLPRAMSLLLRLLDAPELSFGVLIGSLFLVVVGAEEIGLHGSLGALLFGASLSGLPNRTRQDIMPGMKSTAEGLFVPLFFASAGLRLDFSFIGLPLETIAALVAIPLLGKLAGAFIGTYVARLDTPFVFSTGLMAKGVAEIALLLILLETGVIGQDVFSLLVFIMFGYILLMPQAINAAVSKAKDTESQVPPQAVPPSFARYALDSVLVRSVMDRTRTYPTPDVSLRTFANDWLVPNQQDYLVVEEGVPVGVVSLAKLRFMRKGSWGDTALGSVLRRNVPQAWPDEPIDDVLERMANHSLTIIPIMERDSNKFLGSIASHDVLDLMVLMNEIEDEAQRQQGDDEDTQREELR